MSWSIVGHKPDSPCHGGIATLDIPRNIPCNGMCSLCLFEVHVSLPDEISEAWLVTERQLNLDVHEITIRDNRVISKGSHGEYHLLPFPLNQHEGVLKQLMNIHPNWIYSICFND